MSRCESEALIDAKYLIQQAEQKGIGQPGMLGDVVELLNDLHDLGSPACLEAARRVSRAFAVVKGGVK